MKKWIPIVAFVLVLSGCKGLFTSPVTTQLNPGYDIVSIGEEWVDEGCVITGKDIDSVELFTEDIVDSSIPGETIVTYHYQVNELDYICKRVVKVIDQQAPVITLLPGIDTIAVDQEFIDGGYLVTDNYSTTIEVQVENNVNTSVTGTYEVIYTAIDEAGNQTVTIRVVHVIPHE